MSFHVELHRPERRFGINCIVWRDGYAGGPKQVLHYVKGIEQWDDVSPNVEIEPTYIFPDEILEQIISVSEGMIPKPRLEVVDVLSTDVRDARVVRDRLLSIIESYHVSVPS